MSGSIVGRSPATLEAAYEADPRRAEINMRLGKLAVPGFLDVRIVSREPRGASRRRPQKRFVSSASVFVLAVSMAQAQVSITPPGASNEFGTALVALPDVNGDLVEDLAVGDPGARKVYIISGGNGSVITNLNSPDPTLPGLGNRFGASLDLLTNSNGVKQLVVGDPGYDIGSPFAADVGSAYVYSVSFPFLIPPAGSVPRLYGAAAGAALGAVVANLGDVNGDGFADLGLGLPSFDGVAGVNSGEARVLYGFAASGAAFPYSLCTSFSGSQPNERMGAVMRGGTDFNLDGRADYLIGAPGAHNLAGDAVGAVFVYGSPSGACGAQILVASLFGDFVDGEFGAAADFGDNMDCDPSNIPEIVVGAPAADPSGIESVTGVAPGAVYAFANLVAASTSAASATATVVGSNPIASLGTVVAKGGDVTGDGIPDVILGEGRSQGASTDPLYVHTFGGASGSIPIFDALAPLARTCVTETSAAAGRKTVPGSSIRERLSSGFVPMSLPTGCGGGGGPPSGVTISAQAAAATVAATPAFQVVCQGGTATMTATVSGATSGGSFAWYFHQVGAVPALVGLGATLTIGNLQDSSSYGQYRCVVTNGCHTIQSNFATLSVSHVPQIAGPTPNAAQCVGSTLALTANVVDVESIVWRFNSVPLASLLGAGGLHPSGALVLNATSGLTGAPPEPQLVIYNLTTALAGTYDYVATNACGSIISPPTTITVPASGLTLSLSQADDLGNPHLFRMKAYCGPASAGFFCLLSLDLVNGIAPGTGAFFGLHISPFDALAQWSTGGLPFHGSFDAFGEAEFLLFPNVTAAAIGPPFFGLAIFGVMVPLGPGVFPGTPSNLATVVLQ